MKKIVTLLLVTLLCLNMGAFANEKSSYKSSDYTVREITEKEYVESMSERLDISFDEAYKILKEENQKVLSSRGVQTRAPLEVVKYKQITRYRSLSNSNQSVAMATEVRYLYSNAERRPLEILDEGSPHMSMPGIGTYRIDGGGYNINGDKTNVRISRTCTLVYEVGSSDGLSVGGDILSYTKTVSKTFLVTTRPITFIMYIDLDDLR